MVKQPPGTRLRAATIDQLSRAAAVGQASSTASARPTRHQVVACFSSDARHGGGIRTRRERTYQGILAHAGRNLIFSGVSCSAVRPLSSAQKEASALLPHRTDDSAQVAHGNVRLPAGVACCGWHTTSGRWRAGLRFSQCWGGFIEVS